MSARVLVTRAEPGASATARRLAEAGYAPIIEPLFTLETVRADLPGFDALAFTSANGVRAFADHSARRDAPVYCVGRRTAEAALAAGFVEVTSADGDVAALAALIESRLAPGARLLHAGNEQSRGDLAMTLRSAGLKADFRALYRARPVTNAGPALAACLGGETAFEAVLVHSPRAGQILAGLLAASPAPPGLKIAAISRQAAEPLMTWANRVEMAYSPDETSLLAALARLLPKT
ncbi:MAG: uroporphyrinogen-III synthase [Alphaproteobacteria bacterium]|nr:uroporphyrinogen-III synthase [Alphaproteobacteria bacterium]